MTATHDTTRPANAGAVPMTPAVPMMRAVPAAREAVAAGPPAGLRPAEAPAPRPDAAQPLDEPVVADQGVWRGAIVGAVLGFLFTVVLVAVGGSLAGLHPAAAIGIGAFAGIWSGVGFGFMMGGSHMLAPHAIEARSAAPPH
jgi:hypothetical protein